MVAKSVEDTALYRYHALLGAERGRRRSDPAGAVGGRISTRAWRGARRAFPARPDRDRHPRHQARRGRAHAHPGAVRRSPSCGPSMSRNWQQAECAVRDIGKRRGAAPPRPRIYALSERWSARGRTAPIDESFVQRIEDYALKAAREGKLETSWLNPNEDYEQGLRGFIRAILDRGRRPARFCDSFASFARRAALLGALNSLTQLVAQGDDAGRAGFLSGNRGLGPVPGRSRQPPSCRFCVAPGGAGRRHGAGLARTRVALDGRPDQACADPPAAVAAKRMPALFHRRRL